MNYCKMKRLFDITLSLALIPLVVPVVIAVSISIKVTSKGPIIYWSKRKGRGGTTFHMAKFRTMQVDTPQVATHLMTDYAEYLTPIGGFLRKSSIDEIPQIWNILYGDMSFVGPRPALFNQDDLVLLRDKYGINELVPGLTGWAQINGRDELSISQKVQLERHYFDNKGILFDIKIICKTVINTFSSHGISH